MRRWLAGQDEAVSGWAGAQLGITFVQPLRAFGIINEADALIGAAIFNDFYPGGNVELTYVGPGTMTRTVLCGLADFAFLRLEASRVTVKQRRGNPNMKGLNGRAGFSFEMIQKRYYGPTRDDDALVFVLWRKDAHRWLKGMN